MPFACHCDPGAMVFQHRAVRTNREDSCGCGSVGRASPCQGEGRGFESRHPLGRLAQRERASLTRKRSLVQSQYRAQGFLTEPVANGVCHADVAQLVAHHLAKVRVASSSLVIRSGSSAIARGGAFCMSAGPNGHHDDALAKSPARQ